MSSRTVLFCVLSGAFFVGSGRVESGDVFPDGVRPEKLFERPLAQKGGLTEGPAVAPDGSIFFSDIVRGEHAGRILRFDPRTRAITVAVANSRKSNGLMFDRSGNLVACEGADGGGRAVVRYPVSYGPFKRRGVPSTGRRSVLVDRFEGRRLNSPNDLVLDDEGRIYFTDPRYNGAEPRELSHRSVYRLDRSGTLVEITREVSKPNGILISADGRTLYVAETDNGTDRVDPAKPPAKKGMMRLLAFRLDEKGAVEGRPRVLRDFGGETGVDGMTLDRRGRLYLAVRSAKRPGILVIDADGREADFLDTRSFVGAQAKGLPANCVFGKGLESDTLYFTVDTCLFRIRVRARGFLRPTARQSELLRTFFREFVRVTPGQGLFSETAVVGRTDGPSTEAPRRSLKLSKEFSIARYEVPQDLWEAVMGFNPSRWKGPRNSVEELSFDEAVRFCEESTWLLRRLGLIEVSQVVRLPSEVEWEYCARAGTSTRYSFGDSVEGLGDHAWFHGNAAGNDPPVGVKKPNAWGLYDVHGYLWEFCADHWHDDYRDAPRTREAWRGKADGTFVVLRGGSWKDGSEKLTSTFRRKAMRTLRDDAVGLRCVLE